MTTDLAQLAVTVEDVLAAQKMLDGVYRSADFAFNMAGDWIVTVSVETADGREASSESFVTVASR